MLVIWVVLLIYNIVPGVKIIFNKVGVNDVLNVTFDILKIAWSSTKNPVISRNPRRIIVFGSSHYVIGGNSYALPEYFIHAYNSNILVLKMHSNLKF